MKSVFTIIAFFFVQTLFAQNIPAYKAEDLMKRIQNEDTLYVINFWATWCAPCVHELPEFDKLYKQYSKQPVKIILVSLDFPEDYKIRLAHFVEKKKMLPEVVWLNEAKPNDFIPKIENRWQGSIPATLIVQSKTHYRSFIERSIEAEQLQALIDKQLAL